MGRSTVLALIAAAILTLFALPAPREGFMNALKTLVEWNYHPVRDMRRSVSLPPQKIDNRGPDPASVPTIGVDPWVDRDVAAERLHNPIASSDASIARGDSIFHKLCVPCHGRSMAGDGPVASMFMPPPDLLAEQTRNRKDGYIYSYIRHGGVVMPSYGFQVSAEEAWHLINFIRHQQQVSPR